MKAAAVQEIAIALLALQPVSCTYLAMGDRVFSKATVVRAGGANVQETLHYCKCH